MTVKTIRDIKLGRNTVLLSLEENISLSLPRREAEERLLKPAGDYDNGKWTALGAYKKLIGQEVQVECRTLKKFHGPGLFVNHTGEYSRPVVTLYTKSGK